MIYLVSGKNAPPASSSNGIVDRIRRFWFPNPTRLHKLRSVLRHPKCPSPASYRVAIGMPASETGWGTKIGPAAWNWNRESYPALFRRVGPLLTAKVRLCVHSSPTRPENPLFFSRAVMHHSQRSQRIFPWCQEENRHTPSRSVVVDWVRALGVVLDLDIGISHSCIAWIGHNASQSPRGRCRAHLMER